MSKRIKHFYEFGYFRFSPKEKCLWRNDELLQLSPKALEVLNLLLERANEVVTRAEILGSVWKDTFVDESNLTVAISNLRKTLGENNTTQFIQTVPTKGYRFVADIKAVAEDETGNAGDSSKMAADGGLSENPAPIFEKSRSRVRWHFVAVVLLGVFLLTSFTLWLSYSGNSGLSSVPVNERNIKSIAILPLMSIGGEDPSLSIGLTDNLITRLGKLNRFAVRPLSAVDKFEESGKDALEFANALKVDAVLVGTVQADKGLLRVNVRLLDTRDGAHIWSESFDEPEADLFKLLDDLSVRVTGNLVAKLTKENSGKITESETKSIAAFLDYSKGKFYLEKRTKEDIEKAIGFFEKAIKRDENFASAYTSLANCYLLLSDSAFGYYKPMENAGKIRKIINKALELNPNSAETHSTMGFLEFNIDWDIDAALKSYEKSISINPNLAQTHQWYGWTLLSRMRFAEAEMQMNLAHYLDPTSRIIATEKGLPILYAGRYEEAIPYFRRSVEMDKNFFQARFRLWYALYFSEKYDEAKEELEAMKRLVTIEDPFYLVPYGMTLAKTGKRKEAMRIFSLLEKRKESGEYIMPVLLASLAAMVEDKNRTFKWLEEGYSERNDYLLYLKIAPEYKKLHNDKRFVELVSKVGAS